jgi:hypothetical protein
LGHCISPYLERSRVSQHEPFGFDANANPFLGRIDKAYLSPAGAAGQIDFANLDFDND